MGLTGSFGAGKSTVAGLFKKNGAHVISADRLAHEVFHKTNPVSRKIRSLFPEIKGSLTRAKVAQIIFQDPSRRLVLESVIHPYVFQRIEEDLAKKRKGISLMEIPLLFETGFDRRCDKTIVVKAPREKVLKRLRAKGFGKSEIEKRRLAQMSDQEKNRRADYLIDNSNGLEKTKEQVKTIWSELLNIQKGAN